ncbi:MAG: hypothetical protein FJ109_01775 [Deltaproteobacteria bacterium]|nr:hypothetical protein [Deltaproteobacteria bacterium]
MRRVLSGLLVAAVLVFAQACGSDESLTKEEAGQVFGAASGAAGQVQGQVFSGMAQAPAADEITVGNFTYSWTDTSFTFTGTVESAEGGSATVEGSGTWDAAGQSASFEFSMTFNAYASQGIVLDGVLEMSFAGSQQNYEMTYSGDIQSSGKVVGSVTFDLTIKMSPGKIEYAGTVGGQKVGASATYDIPSY